MSDASIRPDYESTTIRITDLAVTDDRVEKKVFSNCHIVGPAVVAPMGCTFSGCGFDVANGDPESMLIVVPDRWLVGVIALMECEFYECRFTRIGFVMGEPMAEAFLTGIRGSG